LEPETKIKKPPWIQCYITGQDNVTNQYNQIIDGNSMINVIPTIMANDLIGHGIVNKMEQEDKPFQVTFGKEEAVSTLQKFIRGAGLIDKVYISSDIRVAIISEITFTDQGITIIKTADNVWGITNMGNVAFTGHRHHTITDKALWEIDIVQLLQAPAPSHPPINQDIQCFSMRPTFNKADVRVARKLQKSFGALHALADTIEAGAIQDVPSTLTPALLRRIAEFKDNIPFELSHRRKSHFGGSGVHTIRPGEEFNFDEIGKWKPSTFGATSAILISDRATGVCTPYGIHSKNAVIDVLIVYCRFIDSLGWKVLRARCDKSSMTTAADFKDACAKLNISVVPAPAEEKKPPVAHGNGW